MPKLHILEDRTYWIGASSSPEAVRVRELLALESFSRPMVLFERLTISDPEGQPERIDHEGRATPRPHPGRPGSCVPLASEFRHREWDPRCRSRVGATKLRGSSVVRCALEPAAEGLASLGLRTPPKSAAD